MHGAFLLIHARTNCAMSEVILADSAKALSRHKRSMENRR